MSEQMLNAALGYAEKGWVIFPCKSDKSPYTKLGFKDASKDATQITQWWTNWPDAMIGLPTGSVNNIWALDVDIIKKPGDIAGTETLAALCAEHGSLPVTLCQKTPSGVEHYIFHLSEHAAIKSRVKFLDGLDVRADGGYIIIAPSHNGKIAYEIMENCEPAAAPQWLVELVTAPKKRDNGRKDVPATAEKQLLPYVEAALRNNMEAIAKAEPGTRNDMLFKNVAALAGFIPFGFIDEATIRKHAEQAYRSCNPEGFAAEFQNTFHSAVEHGKKNPREIPARLPSGFKLIKDGANAGVWYDQPTKKDAEALPIKIGAPLVVRGYIRDKSSSSWGRLVEWHDPDNVKHSEACPAAMFTSSDGSSWKTILANGGYSFSAGRKNQDLLGQYLLGCMPEMRFIGVNRTGWHGDRSFVLPDEIIGNDIKNIILVNTPHRNPYAAAGTLAEWRENVGRLAAGNSRLILALCIAFAPPLLHALGEESVGFNFVGASSIGKSTALLLAASVWGKGASGDGYVLPWRSTDNALEAQAALHSDTLLCLDEMSQAPARVVSESAYMLGNNQGKARANRKGDSREVKNWRLMFLSNGEQSLENKLMEDGKRVRAGQAVRLLDIPADAGAEMGLFENIHNFQSASAMADAIKQACATFYGTASRAFIARVIEIQRQNHKLLHNLCKDAAMALCPEGADGQVKRASAKFALCHVAGLIAAHICKSGKAEVILPLAATEIETAVKTCFAAWLNQRGGKEALEERQVMERALAFLQTQSSRFESLADKPSILNNIPRDRAGFKRTDGNRTVFYILSEVFKKEICCGIPATNAAKYLAKQGVLLRGENGHWQQKLPVETNELGRPRVYALCSYENS